MNAIGLLGESVYFLTYVNTREAHCYCINQLLSGIGKAISTMIHFVFWKHPTLLLFLSKQTENLVFLALTNDCKSYPVSRALGASEV